ncbi:MAG: hypothetical protein A3G34_15475 [Candidatus Lindowbacteria bacterium RIFCSPLOWO2_12_FULL_62_27]|nr:MAG: hypothetical protein A3G34_15475 [Candidatus Lindowbacteria bacterium RIFCSPLOWO2_12_FULL_62_27]
MDGAGMICPDCGYDNYQGEEVCERCLHDLTQVDTAPRPKNEMHRHIIEDPVSRLNPAAHLLSCKPGDKVSDVIESMKKQRLGCVVIEDNRRLIGVFTERDVVMKLTGKPVDPRVTPVRALMTSPAESVKSTDSIAYVLNKMSIGGFRHVPIADESGRATGVVSVRNILEYLAAQIH